MALGACRTLRGGPAAALRWKSGDSEIPNRNSGVPSTLVTGSDSGYWHPCLAEYGLQDRHARYACPGDFALVQVACFAGLVLCARMASRGRAAPPGAAGRATDPITAPAFRASPTRSCATPAPLRRVWLRGPERRQGERVSVSFRLLNRRCGPLSDATTTTQIQRPAVGAAGSPGQRPARLPGPDHLAGRHSLQRAGASPH